MFSLSMRDEAFRPDPLLITPRAVVGELVRRGVVRRVADRIQRMSMTRRRLAIGQTRAQLRRASRAAGVLPCQAIDLAVLFGGELGCELWAANGAGCAGSDRSASVNGLGESAVNDMFMARALAEFVPDFPRLRVWRGSEGRLKPATQRVRRVRLATVASVLGDIDDQIGMGISVVSRRVDALLSIARAQNYHQAVLAMKGLMCVIKPETGGIDVGAIADALIFAKRSVVVWAERMEPVPRWSSGTIEACNIPPAVLTIVRGVEGFDFASGLFCALVDSRERLAAFASTDVAWHLRRSCDYDWSSLFEPLLKLPDLPPPPLPESSGPMPASPDQAGAGSGRLLSEAPTTARGPMASQWRLDRFTMGAPPVQEFILAPLFPLGVAGILFGPGGVGKSMVALDFCLSVARAAPAPRGNLNFFQGPLGGRIPSEAAGAALFITLEDSAAEIHRRISALDPQNTRSDTPCYVIPAVDIPEFDPTLIEMIRGRGATLTPSATKGIDQLITDIQADSGYPVRLLILDPAGDFIGADENDAEPVKRLMRYLRASAARYKMTIVLLGHISKGFDPTNPSMRGSSAWVANSRAAFALWSPSAEDAAAWGRKAAVDPCAIVCGVLTKANHAEAPVGRRRLFERQKTGRLVDITDRVFSPQGGDGALLEALIQACAEAAAAGVPFMASGAAGLYEGRADLPAPLNDCSKARLAELAEQALATGRLVKARLGASAPRWLDVPEGHISTGHLCDLAKGSRADVLARSQRKVA